MVSALFLTFDFWPPVQTQDTATMSLQFFLTPLLFFFQDPIDKMVSGTLSLSLCFLLQHSINHQRLRLPQNKKITIAKIELKPVFVGSFFRFSSLHLLFFRTEILTRTGTSFVQGYPEIFFPFRNLTSKAICLLISQMVVRVVVRRSWKSEFHE